MQLVEKTITLAELKRMSEKMFGGLVKAVLDIEKQIMVVDAELHADEELFLLDQDSQQENLWGINLYPDLYGKEGWIEFDSMINIRPSWGNRSRSVEDPKVQQKIIEIINTLIKP